LRRAEIKFDDYPVKAFLDANIILECRPLPELPWSEIDAEGPIIALITPTAMKEVDSKKQDGRIGKRAREFNRLIAPVAAGGRPIVIRESGPRVELALSRAPRIPWDQHDDLDPEDGDSRIVAEALHAMDMGPDGKLIVSHDIKPIAFASGYEIETLHVSDSWLRPSEPGPSDRENQKLKQQLAEFKANQPEFEITVELPNGEPVPLFRIEDLTPTEGADILRKIHLLNPPARQDRDRYGIMSSIGSHDHTYDDRFKAYRQRLAGMMGSYSQRLEKLFNQAELTVRVTNSGKMQAENLLVEVRVENGWLHERFAVVSPQGPSAPQVRSGLHYLHTPVIRDFIPPRVGRHEYEFKVRPDCGASFEVTCADFRHGQEWSFDGVVGFDPRGSGTTTVTVFVTASNYRGTADLVRPIEANVETVHVSKVLDLATLLPVAAIPMRKHMDAKNYGALDLKAFEDDDHDD
jgi:hypothetical protein